MRRIEVVELLTLDGVMQAPGDPDEDTSGGFEHGGWAAPFTDDVIGEHMGRGMGGSELLFGRRTYEILHAAWADREDPNPFTKVLNETPKYVASRTLSEPLVWQNSTLLDGDAAAVVERLKAENGADLAIMGSGELVRSLLAADLVDRFTLLIHPLVLGSGKRLFDDGGAMSRLHLAESATSTTGVLIARYC